MKVLVYEIMAKIVLAGNSNSFSFESTLSVSVFESNYENYYFDFGAWPEGKAVCSIPTCKPFLRFVDS